MVLISYLLWTCLLGSNTYLIKDSLIGNISGNSFCSFDASSSLLLRAAIMTFACSSRVKFFQVNVGSMYSRYISKISLWLTTPGLVKFQIPRKFRLAISIEIGSNSSKIVMLLGMFTTFWYREIFVMKFRGFWRSEVMGIRTRRVHTLSNSLRSSSTCSVPKLESDFHFREKCRIWVIQTRVRSECLTSQQNCKQSRQTPY